MKRSILCFVTLMGLIFCVSSTICQEDFQSQISFVLLEVPDSESNGKLIVSYYNKDQNILGRYKVKLNPQTQKGVSKTLLDICQPWVSKVRSAKIEATTYDGVGYYSFSVSAGRNVETFNDFWLDNPVQQLSDYKGRSAFSQKKINF